MKPSRVLAAGMLATLPLAAVACSSGGTHAKPTVNPTVSAELQQGRALVASCFPGTLVQQANTVHLVFLSSAKGKHGPQVIAARDKVFGCLHISDPAKRQAFLKKAGEDALHGHLATREGRVTYFQVTLPRDVLAAGGTSAGMGTSTAQPKIPGTTSSSQ